MSCIFPRKRQFNDSYDTHIKKQNSFFKSLFVFIPIATTHKHVHCEIKNDVAVVKIDQANSKVKPVT